MLKHLTNGKDWNWKIYIFLELEIIMYKATRVFFLIILIPYNNYYIYFVTDFLCKCIQLKCFVK